MISQMSKSSQSLGALVTDMSREALCMNYYTRDSGFCGSRSFGFKAIPTRDQGESHLLASELPHGEMTSPGWLDWTGGCAVIWTPARTPTEQEPLALKLTVLVLYPSQQTGPKYGLVQLPESEGLDPGDHA